MSMEVLIRHPSSQAQFSSVALRLTSLCSQHVTYEIKFRLLGRHSRTLTVSCQLSNSCHLSTSSLLSSLVLGIINTPAPQSAMTDCPETHVSTLPYLCSCCFLCQECPLPVSPLAPAAHLRKARPSGTVAGLWQQYLNRRACEYRELHAAAYAAK